MELLASQVLYRLVRASHLEPKVIAHELRDRSWRSLVACGLPYSPAIRDCRSILRKSPWTRITHKDIIEAARARGQELRVFPWTRSSSCYEEGFETAFRIAFTRYGGNFGWELQLNRAAFEDRIPFVLRERKDGEIDPIPFFRVEDALALNLTSPTSQLTDLIVAADEMMARGLWLGEPLALWLSIHSKKGNAWKRRYRTMIAKMCGERLQKVRRAHGND